MDVHAFISPWINSRSLPSSKSIVSTALPSLCPTRHDPRMALVSHEKLDTVFGAGDDEIAKYKLVLMIPGTHSRTARKKSIDALKKNANFPGFRPGTIPPFIKKDVDSFVLRDSVDEIISEACLELGLKPTEGEKGGPELDFDAMMSSFKVGADFEFECTIPLGVESKDSLTEPEFLDADVESEEVKEESAKTAASA